MALPTLVVAGTIDLPDTTPLDGQKVRFVTTAEMVDAGGNVLVPRQVITAKVVGGALKAADGTSALTLFASDTGSTTVPYRIKEMWSSGRDFTVNLLTTDVVAGSIKYSTLGPVSPAPTPDSPYAFLSDVEARDAAVLEAAEAYTDAHAGGTETVAGVAPVSGDVPVAPLVAALESGGLAAAADLSAEATARIAADTALSSAVAAETTRSEAAEALALLKASNLSDLANAATARTNLGLGTAATHAATDFDAAGAAAAAQAASQPLDPDLTAIAGLDASTAGAIASDGAGWIKKTYAQFKTALALVKADVGLGNVDNTADTAKPVSTAQQTALDLKANLASPTFTGHPVGVTEAAGNNSTRLATTAYADGAVATETTRATAAEAANAAAITTGDTTVTANTQTASYVLVLGDAGKVLEMNVAGANTLTIPPHSSVAFPVGTVLEAFQLGAGQCTLTAGAGVTLRSDGAKVKTAGQYATVGLRQRATDEWVLSGDLA